VPVGENPVGENPVNAAPVGTGPFVFKEWVKGSHIILERNPNYWDKGKPYVDQIAVRIIRDPNARSLAFRAGGLDLGRRHAGAALGNRWVRSEPGFRGDVGRLHLSRQPEPDVLARKTILVSKSDRDEVIHVPGRNIPRVSLLLVC
jgi:ABC-type transport system substrate-binding protein